MKLDAQAVVVAAKDQVATSMGNETIILGITAGRYYGVDTVGARIWQMVQKPTCVGDIRDTIVSEYEVEAERCEADLVNLLEQMIEARLIEVRAAIAS